MENINQEEIRNIYNLIQNSRKRYGDLKKCEIHIHTPASYDYRLHSKYTADNYINLQDLEIVSLACSENLITNEAKETISKRIDYYRGVDYCDKLIKEGKPYNSLKEYITYKLIAHRLYQEKIEVAVITDHNTILGFDKLKFALNEYFHEHNGQFDKVIYLFLGVEISCSELNHVVAIFDENDKDKLEAYLKEILISEKGGTYCNSYDVIKNVYEKGGIAYIAHINSSELYGSFAYKEMLFKSGVLKIVGFKDISKKNQVFDRIRSFNDNAINEFCCIAESDSHELDTLGKINTWIKFSQINFPSLKRAFEEHNICVYTEKPLKSDKYIKGILIKPGENGFLTCSPNKITNSEQQLGFSNDFIIDFSQDLNCIIGGRGTGKSTLLNVIEMVFAQNIEDLEVLKFVSKNELIYIIFHYNEDDYVLRFIPQVEQIYEDKVILLENSTDYSYDHYHLNEYWTQLYKVNEKFISKVNNIEKAKIIDGIYRSGHSVNNLVNKVNNGNIGSFIKRTILYGCKNDTEKRILQKIKSATNDEFFSCLKRNLPLLIKIHNEQSEEIIRRINGFNQSHEKQLKVLYTPNRVKVDEYLEEVLKEFEIISFGHVANTYLNWESAELFIKRVSASMGYLDFLNYLINGKYEQIEQSFKISSFIDESQIGIEIDLDLERISNKNLASVYKEILKLIIKNRQALTYSIQKWLELVDDFLLSFNINSKESVKSTTVAFKDLNKLSLGQKVVALLTFVFNYGIYTGDNTPLIIDQPEDNLDNQYIYKNLVKSLKELKKTSNNCYS